MGIAEKRIALGQRLAQIAAENARTLPEAYYKVLRKSVAYLRDSGLFDGALRNGDSLPAFKLQNASRTFIESRDLLAKGPLVISFFRGDWCRFCSETLTALSEIDAEVRQLGATQVAISPDLPEFTAETVQKMSLPFEVLSDSNSKFGLKCGISYPLPGDLAEAYHAISFINRHGSSDFFLPIPAVFIADQFGIIRLSYIEPDYQKRLEPQTILDTLERLKG